MEQSEHINELATALAKAQGQFKAIERSALVDTGKYKFAYAPLDCIVEEIRKPLSDNGLSFCQGLNGSANGNVIETMLMHASGQWLRSIIPVRGGDGNAQAFGSAITYAKRYALTAMLGIVTEDDDDGNKGSGNENAVVTRRDRPPGVTELRERLRLIAADLESAGDLDTMETILNYPATCAAAYKACQEVPDVWAGIPGQPSGFKEYVRQMARRAGEPDRFNKWFDLIERSSQK
jgi:hypothetical protein